MGSLRSSSSSSDGKKDDDEGQWHGPFSVARELISKREEENARESAEGSSSSSSGRFRLPVDAGVLVYRYLSLVDIADPYSL